MTIEPRKRSPLGAPYRSPLGAFGGPLVSAWTGQIWAYFPQPVGQIARETALACDFPFAGAHTFTLTGFTLTGGTNPEDFLAMNITGETSGEVLDMPTWLAQATPFDGQCEPGTWLSGTSWLDPDQDVRFATLIDTIGTLEVYGYYVSMPRTAPGGQYWIATSTEIGPVYHPNGWDQFDNLTITL